MVWDKIDQFLSLLPEPFTDENKQKRLVTFIASIFIRESHSRARSKQKKNPLGSYL